VEWLLQNAPGFSALSDEERVALAEFALLWSLFEARIMDTNASAPRIYKKINDWADSDQLQATAYADELAYFRGRYFDGSGFTQYFDGLNLRRDNKPSLVADVLSGANDQDRDCVGVIHTIVLRIRNNLFHGMKWQYHLQGQLKNFRTANSVLIKTLERHGDLGGH
jgi:hypothetical protein